MIHRLPSVYPITDTGLSGLSHAEQVTQLSAGGATFIQLREKNLSPADFYKEARVAVEIARRRQVRIIINDRVDVAAALGTDGVHLGQDDLPPEAARRLLGNAAIIGFSTHNVDQARKAAALPIDYLAIGPIFRTETKHATEPPVGLEGIRTVRSTVGNLQIVAIGGITSENAKEVLAAGADSVAVISALLSDSPGISNRTRTLIERLMPLQTS
jgi:thiamine-phosphate pyrophosphorylase